MATPQLPDISVPWEDLEDAAADMALRAGVTAGYLTDAVTAWQGFSGSYREPETEDTVYAALDDVKEPLQSWRDSLWDMSRVINDFAIAGRALQQRVQGFRAAQNHRAPQTDDEAGDEGAEQQLLEEAAALAREWTDLQETTAAAIGAIAYGDGAGLPMASAMGGSALPPVGWAALTSQLDDRFGALHPDQLLRSLRGLDEEELREWADANPEAAALLAGRDLAGPFRAGTPEQIMRAAMADGADLTEDGVAGIRDAWKNLSAQDQERLLLLFPAVFGNLNGVPFAQRAKANIVTVAGYRHTVQTLLDGLKEPMSEDYGQDYVSQQQWVADMNAYDADKERLPRILKGLDYALKNDTQVVMVGTEGNGQIVTMVGTPSASTNQVATLVPGTGAHLGELRSYTDRLTAIAGKPSDGTLSFYYQGVDLPQSLVLDNATAHFNETGAPRLAAFDFALDLEIPSDARSTYVGYSAGGSLMGTAEREGLDSSNIVYVAPAGPGHEVGSPADTANPDANRYWVQTRDDPIQWAQDLGGSAHSGSFLQTGSPESMGATRLETGFLNPKDPDTTMTGHVDYFYPGSTAATNIQGVIEGRRVSLFVEDTRIQNAIGTVVVSDFERHPENYANGKLDTVRVKDLEQ